MLLELFRFHGYLKNHIPLSCQSSTFQECFTYTARPFKASSVLLEQLTQTQAKTLVVPAAPAILNPKATEVSYSMVIQKKRPNIITNGKISALNIVLCYKAGRISKTGDIFSKILWKWSQVINYCHLKRTVKTLQKKRKISLPIGSCEGTKSSANVFYLQAAFI